VNVATAQFRNLKAMRFGLYGGDIVTGNVYSYKRSGDGYSETPQILPVHQGNSIPVPRESPDGLALTVGDFVTGTTLVGEILNFTRASTGSDWNTTPVSTVTGEEKLDGFGKDVAYHYGQKVIVTHDSPGLTKKKPILYDVETLTRDDDFITIATTQSVPQVERFFDDANKLFIFYLLETNASDQPNATDAKIHTFTSNAVACP
jgi:hypothetical protein